MITVTIDFVIIFIMRFCFCHILCLTITVMYFDRIIYTKTVLTKNSRMRTSTLEM